MGDSKRRKKTLGDQYGKAQPEPNISPFLPVTKTQAAQFVEITTKGAWVGIGLLAASWVVIHFVGPALGLWKVVG
jgi:Protein of unknown function (DUF2839)